MHTDDQIYQALDIPFVDLDIPCEDLVFEDLPSIDEVLRSNPMVTLSPLPTVGQTLYSERISIRIPRWLLEEIKKRAAAEGEKYQTFMNSILAQYATKTI